MNTPTTTSIKVTREEAMVIAAHLKLTARRMEHASDCALPGVPHLPKEMASLLKGHSAVFEQFADKLYAPFLNQSTQQAVDEASEQVAKDLRNL